MGGLIQPELYRAPEVLFEMGWDSSADIWNVGVMIWDLFQGRHLFHALDENEEVSATHHIAEMMAYIGTPPPLEYLRRSQVTSRVFDEEGSIYLFDLPLRSHCCLLYFRPHQITLLPFILPTS